MTGESLYVFKGERGTQWTSCGGQSAGCWIPDRQDSAHFIFCSWWTYPGSIAPTSSCFCSLTLFWPLGILLFLKLRSGARSRVGTPAGPLAPLLAELQFIHSPHGTLLTLYPHKALVQAQIVAYGVLWGRQPLQWVGHPCRSLNPTYWLFLQNFSALEAGDILKWQPRFNPWCLIWSSEHYQE